MHYCNHAAGIEALKERVEKTSLPSQQVATSRMGARNVYSIINYWGWNLTYSADDVLGIERWGGG